MHALWKVSDRKRKWDLFLLSLSPPRKAKENGKHWGENKRLVALEATKLPQEVTFLPVESPPGRQRKTCSPRYLCLWYTLLKIGVNYPFLLLNMHCTSRELSGKGRDWTWSPFVCDSVAKYFKPFLPILTSKSLGGAVGLWGMKWAQNCISRGDVSAERRDPADPRSPGACETKGRGHWWITSTRDFWLLHFERKTCRRNRCGTLLFRVLN